MIALVVDWSSDQSGSILPPRKAAELELNSVSPSPDTVKEEKQNSKIHVSQLLTWEPSQAKVNSKPDIT
jgi:hypothetical protein